VFVATDDDVYGSDDGGDEFGDSDFAGTGQILCMAVSCESDDDYTIAVGTDGGEVWRLVTGGFLSGAWELIGGYVDAFGDPVPPGTDYAVFPGWDDSDELGEDYPWSTTYVTSVAFSPNFDVDDTILVITTNESETYLQTGRLGNVEQWNYIAGSAFPDAVELVDVPPFGGWGYGIPTGIAVSADYDGRKDDLRYCWVYVNHLDDNLDPDECVGRVFQIENDVVEYAGLPCDPEKFTPLLSSISAYGTAD